MQSRAHAERREGGEVATAGGDGDAASQDAAAEQTHIVPQDSLGILLRFQRILMEFQVILKDFNGFPLAF